MIEATFNAVIPTPIIAEFEAIVPREKALEVKNKNITIEQNGSYTVKADAGTTMTEVGVEVDVKPNNQVKEVSITSNGEHIISVDSNFDGMSEVKVVNSVYEGFDLGYVGYTQAMQDEYNQIIADEIAYVKELASKWKLASNGIVTGFNGRGYNYSIMFMPSIDISEATSLKQSFSYCSKLIVFDISMYNTSNIEDMSEVCYSCSSLSYVNFGDCDLSSLKTLNSAFRDTYIQQVNFGNKKDTFNLVDMNGMFNQCVRLKKIDYSNLYTRNVTTFNHLHYYAGGVTSPILEEIIGLNIYSAQSMTGWLGNVNLLKTIHFDEWRQTDINIPSKELLPESINYIIEHALGEEDGATQRTLTLHATAKSNWQKNAEYEKYSAMAYDKLITIA
jgi:hypothetical protein